MLGLSWVIFLLVGCGDTTQDSGPPASEPPVFFEDFDGDEVAPSVWKVAYRNWGGKTDSGEDYNGGVHPDNVSVESGMLVLTAHGDRYTGEPMGITSSGGQRGDGTRVGAAIATEAYMGSGRYEIRMKVADALGVCSAPWTFHYRELYPGEAGYVPNPMGYTVLNHEIDMEMPGRPGSAFTDISFSWALLNTWVGEQEDEYTSLHTDLGVAQNDGEFHTYRFDWRTGGSGVEPEVAFYVDDVLVTTSTTHVPTAAGRLWLGAWFPKEWAGDPDFESAQMVVDWVRVTPFHDSGDEFVPETYPDDGWAESL